MMALRCGEPAQVTSSTGYFDSLSVAVENGRASRVSPERPLSWWVELSASCPVAPGNPGES
jgi:hypothetical protein